MIHLNAFLKPPGEYLAAWRHPDSPADGGVNIAHVRSLARTAEAARFDAVFLADLVGVPLADADVLSRVSVVNDSFEPTTLLAALSAVTTHIGLVATASTTYNEPYHLARTFASLDHLSGGRAGWNLVTSLNDGEARNFGLDAHVPHEQRYARAEEYVDVVRGLWDSFDDDAFLHDQASGRYFRPEALHRLDHRGAHLAVAGPLNIARPPQGHPVIVQAGASEAGKALASRVADVIFTSPADAAAGRAFRDEIRERAAAHGRDPDHVKILPALSTITGRSRAEAEEKAARMRALLHPRVALEDLGYWLGGVDLTAYPLDGPLPELPPSNQSRSTQARVLERARADGLTIRQLAQQVADDDRTLVGTGTDIADHIEEWVRAGAADGFNVIFPYLPGTLDDFASLVVPELQRRGLHRTEYRGRTLRDHLGLPRPATHRSRENR
ncbi:Nitrilotriacetate monooxygenase component A [Pseudonocardia sp. Ae406_Ps2]|uniref:LLM class flavin-dependent oxidoreductase n=1 Tax=unclassified Pseudonocardia TaxID=2619320 RepID=UPI00094B321E|nr:MULTISPECIES: LLM class flavin-dependent oxidoreductase [unclassified Pseudonocardia]OLM01289.1 Nitrilotriacetate monooxygenase component A [Pseudonocardia sp. Ae406_Ps2]OLM06914.1 Nitrilotriacetate monooxygenase component A [Pseudonocardia sp. Ae331_Ps2]OLM14090.1 Nitrilotriacetate monooxygenase component A [Pseudonocardia sp. Ae505_Ps2]OLM22862.1 Nitrilotriacetate monooxygenase component A [Pseudonocardia sp. Ae706_Ps2]OLM31268.1 Nitrilotriacetate monooxygenase component A [Pseudonocardia